MPCDPTNMFSSKKSLKNNIYEMFWYKNVIESSYMKMYYLYHD